MDAREDPGRSGDWEREGDRQGGGPVTPGRGGEGFSDGDSRHPMEVNHPGEA